MTSIEGLLEFEYLTIDDLEYMYVQLPSVVLSLLCKHPLVTIEWIQHRPWAYDDSILCNPNITTDTIDQFPEFNWNWACMHYLKDLNFNFILSHMDKDWNWEMLSMVIDFESVLALNLPNFGFDMSKLSSNPNITVKNVIDHPEIDWVFTKLMSNPSILKDPELNENCWFFVLTPQYVQYKIDNMPFLDPKDINETILEFVPIKTINEKVAKFRQKCETETANVVVTKIQIDWITNWGIRKNIMEYL